MNRLRVPLLVVGLLLCTEGFAANSQQTLMVTCNADATAQGLKGDARREFMGSCLKTKPPEGPVTPQERMTSCNATVTAQALKGDARKAFMSDCLKKK